MRINEQRDLYRDLLRQTSEDLGEFAQFLATGIKYNWPGDWIRTGEVIARLREALDRIDRTLADNNLVDSDDFRS